MRIRFLVHTVSSRVDVNGNCYHYAIITSAASGRTLTVKNLGGEDNAQGLVRRCFDSWEDAGLHRTHEERVPIRQFNARHKAQKEEGGALYEHEITPEMIRALEVEE